MKRDALGRYIRRWVMASLLTGCSSNCPTQPVHDCFGTSGVPDSVLRDLRSDGTLPAKDCPAVCDNNYDHARIDRCSLVLPSGSDPYTQVCCDGVQLECPELDTGEESVGGRRPAGLRVARATAGAALGQHFARLAHLEAASIDAFVRLADELRAHDAPARLRDAALRSAEDERSHAAVTGRLARRFGGEVRPVVIDPIAARTLEEIARENAIEGCVRETFGAAVATWQAHAAGDLRIRAAMRRIAVDETRHAELAFAVARWAEPRLDRAARRRVREARANAAHELARGVDREVSPALITRAGLPPRAIATRLVAQMSAELWLSAA
jgi:hypothetical protein